MKITIRFSEIVNLTKTNLYKLLISQGQRGDKKATMFRISCHCVVFVYVLVHLNVYIGFFHILLFSLLKILKNVLSV